MATNFGPRSYDDITKVTEALTPTQTYLYAIATGDVAGANDIARQAAGKSRDAFRHPAARRGHVAEAEQQHRARQTAPA